MTSYPHLRTEESVARLDGTIGAPVEHLDLATVIKVSQAVSGEIVLEKLIDTLMRTAHRAGGRRARPVDPRRAAPSSGSRRKPGPAATQCIVHLRDEAVIGSRSAGVGAPLRPAHAGKRHSRRRRGPVPVCLTIRTSVGARPVPFSACHCSTRPG